MVSYSHLYDVDECSKFIADFIYYSPERCTIVVNILHRLANMFSVLRVFDGKMNSPTRVINQQTGNSFEMAVLLVSLLRSDCTVSVHISQIVQLSFFPPGDLVGMPTLWLAGWTRELPPWTRVTSPVP